MKIPRYKDIVLALNDLHIPRTQAGVKVKGLRTVVYMYIQHQDLLSASNQMHTNFEKANRSLAQFLPEEFHTLFTKACENYIPKEGQHHGFNNINR